MSVELFNKYFPPETKVAIINPDDGVGFILTVVEHCEKGVFGRNTKGEMFFVPAPACLFFQAFAGDGDELEDDDDDDDDEILGELARKLKAKIIASHQSKPYDAHDEDAIAESRWGRKG